MRWISSFTSSFASLFSEVNWFHSSTILLLVEGINLLKKSYYNSNLYEADSYLVIINQNILMVCFYDCWKAAAEYKSAAFVNYIQQQFNCGKWEQLNDCGMSWLKRLQVKWNWLMKLSNEMNAVAGHQQITSLH